MNKKIKLTRRQEFMLKYYGAWHRKGVIFCGDGTGKWRCGRGEQYGIDEEVESNPVFAVRMYKSLFRPGRPNLATDVWVEEYRPVPLNHYPFPDIAIGFMQRVTGFVDIFYETIDRDVLRRLRRGKATRLLERMKECGIRKHKAKPFGSSYNERGTFSWGETSVDLPVTSYPYKMSMDGLLKIFKKGGFTIEISERYLMEVLPHSERVS